MSKKKLNIKGRMHYDIVKEDDKTSRYSVSLNVIIIKGGKLHF